MKKIIIILLSLIILTGCYQSSDYEYESQYNSGYEDGISAGNEEGYKEGYNYGYEDGYSVGYIDGIQNPVIMDFLDENSFYCCFCGIGDIKEERMVSFIIDNEKYYMCPECATNYFIEIENVKECYYCIMCGNLTNIPDYIHSWTDEHICENCISKCEQCEKCKKWDEDIRNGLCGICGDF